MKQVVVHFQFPHTSLQQHTAAWDELRKSGQPNPKGLLFHVGAPMADGGLFVTDLWESEEDFIAFGKILMPILEKLDIPRVQPNIMPAHYVYEALHEKTVG
jgi:hypothetical protein